MHIDFTFHFWTFIGYCGSLGVVLGFLRKVYQQVQRAVNAAEILLDEHREIYSWYATEVRPKQSRRSNGGTRLSH